MSFGIRTQAARRREIALQVRMQKRLEKFYYKRFALILNIAGKNAGAAYLSSGKNGAIGSLSNHSETIESELKRLYITTGNVFGKHTKDSFKDSSKDFSSFFETALLRWIFTEAAEKAVLISDTTKSQIGFAITAAEQLQLGGQDAIAAEIVKRTSGVINFFRARVIARTEVHNAATFASDVAAESLGIDYIKEWGAVEDARARPKHGLPFGQGGADGQKVKKNDFFIVGGEKMSRPGDSRASARNVINCRCIVFYLDPDDIEGF